MKKLSVILLLLSAIFFFSFCQKKEDFNYWTYSNNLVSKLVNDIAKKNNIQIAGVGGDVMGGTLNVVTLNLFTTNVFTSAQIADVYYEIITEVINGYNEDKIIRPHLADFPISEKNLEISIGFNKFDEAKDTGIFAVIKMEEGRVFIQEWISRTKYISYEVTQ